MARSDSSDDAKLPGSVPLTPRYGQLHPLLPPLPARRMHPKTRTWAIMVSADLASRPSCTGLTKGMRRMASSTASACRTPR